MITNEKHHSFFMNLDDRIEKINNTPDTLKKDKNYLEWCVDGYNLVTYGETLPIVWVTSNNNKVDEFYSSELNLTWVTTFIFYYTEFIRDKSDEDKSVYLKCIYMFNILTKIKGINVVDGITYILGNDVDFVKYKINKNLFI